jgi:cytochrome c oxidase subunit III
MRTLPWTHEIRPDTRTTSVRLGIWLFLASEAMFFGSLFSAYVLLRTGAPSWPDAPGALDLRTALVNTGLLFGATACLMVPASRARLACSLSAAVGVVFLVSKYAEYGSKLAAGLAPSSNLLLACWFTLTAVHALHVVGGVIVNVWLAAMAAPSGAAQLAERMHATRLYWCFLDVVWIVILIAFYAY